MTRSWSEEADDALEPLFASLPDDIHPVDLRRAIRAAYPFPPRSYWQWLAWRQRVAAWLACRLIEELHLARTIRMEKVTWPWIDPVKSPDDSVSMNQL